MPTGTGVQLHQCVSVSRHQVLSSTEAAVDAPGQCHSATACYADQRTFADC